MSARTGLTNKSLQTGAISPFLFYKVGNASRSLGVKHRACIADDLAQVDLWVGLISGVPSSWTLATSGTGGHVREGRERLPDLQQRFGLMLP